MSKPSEVLVTDSLVASGLSSLMAVAPVDEAMSEAEIYEMPERERQRVRVLVATGRYRVTGRILECLPGLENVVSFGVGLDHIDLPSAQQRMIRVHNLRGTLERCVAELTMGLMIATVRHISHCRENVRSENVEPVYSLGDDLYGSTLGLVGVGGIGLEVLKLARAFGMRVLYHKRSPFDESTNTQLEIDYVSFDRLLEESLVVSLHCPLNSETEGLFDKRAFRLMRRDAHLVNTARGGLVQETALLDALDAGQIAGAGLDVFENEPTPSSRLSGHPAVILTPHIGSATRQTRERMRLRLRQIVRSCLGDEQ